jgi:hypothetical protein
MTPPPNSSVRGRSAACKPLAWRASVFRLSASKQLFELGRPPVAGI